MKSGLARTTLILFFASLINYTHSWAIPWGLFGNKNRREPNIISYSVPFKRDSPDDLPDTPPSETIVVDTNNTGPYTCKPGLCDTCLTSPQNQRRSPINTYNLTDERIPQSTMLSQRNEHETDTTPDLLFGRTLLPPIQDDMQSWIGDRVMDAVIQGHDTLHGSVLFPRWTTSFLWPLVNQPATFSIQGLWGCSAVAIMSESDLYTSYIWEESFQFPNNFGNEVLNVMAQGVPNRPNTVGLAGVQSFQAPPNGWLEVVIIAPRTTPDPPAPNNQAAVLRYPQQTNQLRQQIQNLLPHISAVNIIDYYPPPAFQQSPASGKVAIRYDPREDWADCNSPQRARLDLWLEIAYPAMVDHTWNAAQHQLRKRDTCTNSTASASKPASTAPPKTSEPPKTTTSSSFSNPPDFPFTTTLINGEVDACQSSSIAKIGGKQETMCGGSTMVVHREPSVSVQVGGHRQNVGTLVGMPLYTEVSSALAKICPTSNGEKVSCTDDSVSIEGVVAIAGTERVNGKLKVQVESSSYNSTKFRDAMIQAAASVANVSSTLDQNCQEEHYLEAGRGAIPEKITLCDATEFAGVQYYDGVTQGSAMWLDAIWHWEKPSGNPILCELLIEMLDLALVTIGAEFALGGSVAGDFIMAECSESLEG